MLSRNRHSKRISYLGLEFSLQFINVPNTEHFSSFGNLERLYSLLMIKRILILCCLLKFIISVHGMAGSPNILLS